MKTRTVISVILLCCFCFAFASCGKTNIAPSAQLAAGDLMKDIKANDVAGKPADDAFVSVHDDFAAKLLQAAFARSGGKNVLVSPLSVTLALAMTANGAKGETLAEMEKLLGGEMDIKALNEYLKHYVSNLYSGENCKLNVANSVWFREGLSVLRAFLQTNADYYGASAYEEPFDNNTLNAINGWVKEHTDGMIEKIIDDINPDSVMFLINAIVFDAKWDKRYEEGDVSKRPFTKADGTVLEGCEFMQSLEKEYIEYNGARGFKKQYSGGRYSFAAVLPPENVSVSEYAASLDGKTLAALLGSAQSTMVKAYLPKFTFDYEIKLKETLAAMGMPSAFNPAAADFSGIADGPSLCIGEVIHKTHIDVDADGTKAAAVTAVDIRAEGGMAIEPPDIRTVDLNRPFVFMILDNNTDLPVFIGAVTSPD